MAENTDNLTEDQEDLKSSEVTEDEEDVTAEGKEDPTSAAIKAALEAERETISQEVSEKLRIDFARQADEERQSREAEEQAEALFNSFGSTVREVRANLKNVKFFDSDGQERTLSDEALEELVVKPLVRYNQTGERAASLKVLSALANAARETLPETVRDDFNKRASGKPIDKWLDEYAELKAGETQWAKKTLKEQDAAIKAAEARGFKKGQSTTPSSPGVEGEKPLPKGTVDYTSATSLARAYNEGRIDHETFLKHWKKIGD